jgi:hypothetical protein
VGERLTLGHLEGFSEVNHHLGFAQIRLSERAENEENIAQDRKGRSLSDLTGIRVEELIIGCKVLAHAIELSISDDLHSDLEELHRVNRVEGSPDLIVASKELDEELDDSRFINKAKVVFDVLSGVELAGNAELKQLKGLSE